VLKREKRVNVLTELVKSCRLDDDTAAQLLESSLVTKDMAESWFDARIAPASIEYALAVKAGADRATRYALSHPELTYVELRGLLMLHQSVNSELLTRFVESRPDVLDALLADSHPVLQAAALASSHQFDQETFYTTVTNYKGKSPWAWSEVFISIANHPNADPLTLKRLLEFVQGEDFPAQLSYLRSKVAGVFVKRLHEFPYAIQRQWELADSTEEFELLEKLTITNSVRRSKVLGLRSKRVETSQDPKRTARSSVSPKMIEGEILDLSISSFYPTGSVGQVNELFDARFDALGRPAWETAIGLLRSSYEGTVGELIATTEALI